MGEPGPSGSGNLFQFPLTVPVSGAVDPTVDGEKFGLLQQQLQEAFKQKQMDLVAHFERAHQALNMQHLQQYYQQLATAAQNQHQLAAASSDVDRNDELVTAAGAPLTLASSMGSLIGNGNVSQQMATTSREQSQAVQATTGGHTQPMKLKSDMRSMSGSCGSQTISQHTKDRLKNMLAQRNREGSQSSLSGTPPQQHAPISPQVNVSSPHFEPYRVPASLQQQSQMPNPQPEFHQLRKVNSEPNLKMRIRAKLLSKGSSPVQNQNQSTFTFAHPTLHRSDSETSNVIPVEQLLGTPPAFPQHLIMPSPSLPNLAAANLGNAGQMPFDISSLMAAAQLTPFLSLPSLLKAQLGLGGLMDEDSMEKGKLDPRSAHGLSQNVPVGGYPSLLKQQLRELVLRRKSLVREEPEDDDGLSSGAAGLLHSASRLAAMADDMSVGGGGAVSNATPVLTGLAYDSAMARHECVCGESGSHVEHGGRVQSIWARLSATGLVARCEKILAKKASLDQLRLIHSPTYVTFFAVSPTACLKMEASQLPVKSFVQLPCGGIGIDSDTYFNDNSTQLAARVATGSLIELASQVAEGSLRNGFACIRPPGHHAERDQAMGFCFFNNIAITAKQLQMKFPQRCQRIAIIDWDVHHGNGTQLCFDDDPSVLYLSMHRHDNGNFFPGTGAVTDVGRGEGKGFSLNIPFSGDVMRDPEYLAAWRVVVQPVLDHFQPTFILVSAGFDAGCGHANALGGYEVSSAMFGFMTRQLMNYANGRVVLALEGGYDLTTISDAAEQCVRVLCGDDEDAGRLSCQALEAVPNLSAQETIQKVIAIHKSYWPTLTAHQGLTTSEMHWQTVRHQLQNLSMDTS